MRPFVSLVLLAACGSRVQAPTAPLENTRVSEPVVSSPVTTCEDVGWILGDATSAQEITKECELRAWPTTVRACISSEPEPWACLHDPSFEQRFATRGLVESAGSSTAGCDQAMAHVEFFRPKVRDDVPEHAWLDGARVNVLLHDCKHGWSQDLITCLADAWQEDGVLDCLAFRMDDDARDAQEKKLRALEKLAVKVEKARQTPAELDCDHVVAARYADARWKGKLAGVERDRRVQLIEASRTLMRSACIDYEWSEATRACVIVTGELVPCFDDDYATRWGYPAAPAK